MKATAGPPLAQQQARDAEGASVVEDRLDPGPRVLVRAGDQNEHRVLGVIDRGATSAIDRDGLNLVKGVVECGEHPESRRQVVDGQVVTEQLGQIITRHQDA